MEKVQTDQLVLYFMRGIFALIFGAMALLLPASSFTLLILILGIFMIIDGVLSILFTSPGRGKTTQRMIVIAIMTVAVTVMLFLGSFLSIIALLSLFALWSFFSGLNELLHATSFKGRRGTGWYIITILLAILIGLFVLINPTAESFTLSKIFGIYSLLTGLMFIYISFRLKYRPRHRSRRYYPNELSHY